MRGGATSRIPADLRKRSNPCHPTHHHEMHFPAKKSFKTLCDQPIGNYALMSTATQRHPKTRHEQPCRLVQMLRVKHG
eukprot:6177390-Pleurochrysis_carterae.AAC.1